MAIFTDAELDILLPRYKAALLESADGSDVEIDTGLTKRKITRLSNDAITKTLGYLEDQKELNANPGGTAVMVHGVPVRR